MNNLNSPYSFVNLQISETGDFGKKKGLFTSDSPFKF